MDAVDLKLTPNFARYLFATMGWVRHTVATSDGLVLYNGMCFIHLPPHPPHPTSHPPPIHPPPLVAYPEISAHLKKLCTVDF